MSVALPEKTEMYSSEDLENYWRTYMKLEFYGSMLTKIIRDSREIDLKI